MRGTRDATLDTINPHTCDFLLLYCCPLLSHVCRGFPDLPLLEKLCLLIYALAVSRSRWFLAKQLGTVWKLLQPKVGRYRPVRIRSLLRLMMCRICIGYA
ncbi:hypothetical protein GGI35DRAFT_86809 [Trichoderma velutinum]